MRAIIGLAIVSAGLVYGQAPVTQTVRLANIGTPQGLQEAATVLRTVCDIRDVSVDRPTSSITVTGQPNVVALAEWTLTAIDAPGPMASQQYTVPGGQDYMVKVMYLKNTDSAQGIQELLTQLRTVLDLAKVFNVTTPHALVFRGNSTMIAVSSWLISQLDQPFRPDATTASYEMQGVPGGDQVRVYYLHNIASPKPTQELLTAIRRQTGHVFVSTAPRAIAIRATSDRIVATDALVSKLDVPPAK
jgi:type II secretory pathway component GspD/PulD (secretin)